MHVGISASGSDVSFTCSRGYVLYSIISFQVLRRQLSSITLETPSVAIAEHALNLVALIGALHGISL
jgi:hypothetical protein